MTIDIKKYNAAQACLEHVKDGMNVGIGSGSTVAIFIELLSKKIKEEKLNIITVPTSYQVKELLINNGIPISSLDVHSDLDVAIDGADEIDDNLNCIKGGGAALTQEKIVDSCTNTLIIIADESKLVKNLGEKFAVPIEILPMALPLVKKRLTTISKEFTLRMAQRKLGPVISDNGNFIIDIKISDLSKRNLESLEKEINNIPGVIENGLFVNMTKLAYIGLETGVKKLTK